MSSTEALETPLQPLSTVPFPRDPDFVGRESLIDQIDEKSSNPGSRTAIVGLGGVGKTQLAIEYSHRVRCQSADTWVFWIHASNIIRCEESLRDIADRVKIPGRNDSDVNIFQIVGNWLQQTDKWILILDNVDDDELLRNSLETSTQGQANRQAKSSQPPLRYLFQSSNGSIIVTSRNKCVALDIAGPNLVEVQPMNATEAIDLLKRKLNAPMAEHEHMAQLVKELEFMPLAIIQAASFIIHQPRCSILQYLKRLQKSDQEAVRLLNREACLLDRDWEAKNSIIITWQISFDYIRRVRPSATKLLSFISFFDPQRIEEDILRVQQRQQRRNDQYQKQLEENSSSDDDTDNESDADSDFDAYFEDNITMLTDFGLISIGKKDKTFTIHRFIKLTVHTWLKVQNEVEYWKAQFIDILCSNFPACQYQNWADKIDNWELCQSLLPHVKSAVKQRPESQVARQKWASLLFGGAWYAQKSGNFTISKELALKSRQCRLKLFGPKNDCTLDSTTMLATAYRNEGQLEEAEKLGLEVMNICMAKLDKCHPDTLDSMVSLAITYREQGRLEEAENLQVQALDVYKNSGEDHDEVPWVMENLGWTYWKQGRLEEAEKLEVQVMDMNKAKLGGDHPSTLSSISNLAATFRNQGRLEEAEGLEIEVLDISKVKLGEDHPNTLASMSNLAATFQAQARWEEAEKLLVQVTDLSKTKLGSHHPDTLMNMANLTFTRKHTARQKEAN